MDLIEELHAMGIKARMMTPEEEAASPLASMTEEDWKEVERECRLLEEIDRAHEQGNLAYAEKLTGLYRRIYGADPE